MPELSTGFDAQLLKPTEAAALLRVSISTIHNWIKADKIPYIQLPGGEERAKYLIPLQGLIGSLGGNYDLAGSLQALVAAAKESGFDEDAAVVAAGGNPHEED